MTAVPFVKGHGTENDFVLLPDPSGSLQVTAAQVRALCDRRAGLGADGLIVMKASKIPGSPGSPGAGFFMDYRNADGSVAEMCGNGARLFARYLVELGWEAPGRFDFLTRGGVRTAELGAVGDVTIGMGPATVGAASKADVGGVGFAGVEVDVGNPHLVTTVDDVAELQRLDLTRAPVFDPVRFPAGVNIEFVVPLAVDHVRMRVFERGVGETRSCGTGTVAAAAAHLAAAGRSSGRVRVDVPGGAVTVDVQPAGSTLTGPAVVVARGEIDPGFWAASR